jgi:hypothetical protein
VTGFVVQDPERHIERWNAGQQDVDKGAAMLRWLEALRSATEMVTQSRLGNGNLPGQ